ncbi:MAG: DUF4139 domain-containing protein [Gemmatimonadales bacterium]
MIWLTVSLTVAAPLAAQTSVSIYRDGRAVVRQTLPQALQRGQNRVTLRIEGLDPATLFSPDTAVTVVSATLRLPSSEEDALARAVGQTMSFVRAKGDTVRATVVRVAPPQYRLADSRLLLGRPGEPLFPAELVRTTPEASVVLDAARSRPRTELAFVGQGATWEAVYQVALLGRTASVTGAATVTSQELRLDSTAVQLVAGSVARTRQARRYAPQAPMMEAMAQEGAQRADFAAEEAVGETHVYQLPGKLSLEPGVPITTALFPRAAAPVTQELVVPGALPWRGYYGGGPTEPNQVPVQVWYTIRRARGGGFGDRPLPAGTVQLYQPDSAGRAQLVGEAAIGHSAPGRDLRLQSGDAFDVTAERVQTDYRVEQLQPAARGRPARQRVTAAFRVTVANAKSEAITVDVRETRHGEWRIVESSVAPEKLSAFETRFRLPVPAGGEATLTYTVQMDN